MPAGTPTLPNAISLTYSPKLTWPSPRPYSRRASFATMEKTCEYVGWIALALTPGLGPRLAGKLLRAFGDPEAIFNASLTELEAQHLPAAVAQAIHSRQPLSAAAKEVAQAEQLGCKLVTWDE
jgi:hypothetical protein